MLCIWSRRSFLRRCCPDFRSSETRWKFWTRRRWWPISLRATQPRITDMNGSWMLPRIKTYQLNHGFSHPIESLERSIEHVFFGQFRSESWDCTSHIDECCANCPAWFRDGLQLLWEMVYLIWTQSVHDYFPGIDSYFWGGENPTTLQWIHVIVPRLEVSDLVAFSSPKFLFATYINWNYQLMSTNINK